MLSLLEADYRSVNLNLDDNIQRINCFNHKRKMNEKWSFGVTTKIEGYSLSIRHARFISSDQHRTQSNPQT